MSIVTLRNTIVPTSNNLSITKSTCRKLHKWPPSPYRAQTQTIRSWRKQAQLTLLLFFYDWNRQTLFVWVVHEFLKHLSRDSWWVITLKSQKLVQIMKQWVIQGVPLSRGSGLTMPWWLSRLSNENENTPITRDNMMEQDDRWIPMVK